jgi:hypothetical protein
MRDCRPVDLGFAQPVRWLERSSRRLRVKAYRRRRSGFEASHLGYLIFRRWGERQIDDLTVSGAQRAITGTSKVVGSNRPPRNQQLGAAPARNRWRAPSPTSVA